MRTRTLTVLLGVLALAVVLASAGCGGGKQAATPSDSAQPGQAAPAQGAADAPSAVGMNEPAKAGDWTLTVKSTERVAEAGGASAAEGGELLVITFDLENGAALDQGTGPAYFKLADDKSASFEPAPTSDPAFIFNTPQPIKAGETREIKIAYHVTKGAAGLKWTFEPFVEGGAEPVVVNLD